MAEPTNTPALLRLNLRGTVSCLFTSGLDMIRARIGSVAPPLTGEERTHEPEAAAFLREEILPVLDAVEILQEVVAHMTRAETPGGMVVLCTDADLGYWRVYRSVFVVSEALCVHVDSETGMRQFVKYQHPRRESEITPSVEDWQRKTVFPGFWQAWEAALQYENASARLPL